MRTYYPLPAKGSGASATPDNTLNPDYEETAHELLAGGTRTSSLPASFRNRANETTVFTYDPLGRMTNKNLPGSELDVGYAYDLLGALKSASTSAQTLTFTYDALGRQISQTDGSRIYSSAYDPAGRRTRITHPDGFFVTQDYLVTGEMTTIREYGATSGIGVLATYGYDQLGRRTSLTFGNGEKTLYSYDAVSRLQTLTHDLGGALTTNDNTVAFTYNPAGQIVKREASNSAYSWNGHGNGTTPSTADGLNRLIDQGGTGFAYDAKSNMLADGIRTYSYDSENRLTDTSSTIPYYYDPLGRLAGAGTPLAIHYENYIDGLVAERLATSSTVSMRHVFGPGTDEPIVWYNGSGNNDRRFLHADERGSIVAVTSQNQALLAINRYDEYGRTQTSSTAYGRFLYTGQRYFGGIDLYYYKNRFYNPNAGGRFLQPDPIGYGGGMNRYVYVGGDPVNFRDPLGLCGFSSAITSDGYYFGVTWKCQDSGTIGFIGGALGGITYAANRFLSAAPIEAGTSDSGAGEGEPPSGPPLPPDPCNARLPDGSTVNRNVDAMRDVIDLLSDRRLAADGKYVGPMPTSLAIWIERVRQGGRWDYKLQPGGSQQLGNLNFGATGVLMLPLDALLRGAGAVQDPSAKGPGHWTDVGPSGYGDQTADIPAIKRGAAECKGTR